MRGNLVLHCGAREVSRQALAEVEAPAPERRWHPIKHSAVLETVESTLKAVGFEITRERLGLSANNARFFGVLDLAVPIVPNVALAVGIRNSIDRTFPLGFCAGHRVFICDNLAFSAELLAKRKHTRFGATRFRDDIVTCVSRLEEFRLAEASRIQLMREQELTDVQAESFMLRAYEQGIVTRRLPKLIDAWRDPPLEDFRPRTAWSLFNAFTMVMALQAETNPQQFARQTMRLQGLLVPVRGGDSPEVFDVTPNEESV